MKSEIIELGRIDDDIQLNDCYMQPFKSEEVEDAYLEKLLSLIPKANGLSFLTVDHKTIKPNETHRRGGAHIDGNYTLDNGWITPNWNYDKTTGGAILISDQFGCVGWKGEYQGIPAEGGDCEHFRKELETLERVEFKPNYAYFVSSAGIHESILQPTTVKRSLVRITLPESYELGEQP
jgi:hypothetical protein